MPGRNGRVSSRVVGYFEGLNKQRYNNVNPKWHHEHWLSKPLRMQEDELFSKR